MQWINEWELPSIPELTSLRRILLFGAGNGSRELLEFFSGHGLTDWVVAVADNDRTMHGRDLLGVPIIDPVTIEPDAYDLILITTVSGRKPVMKQLAALGVPPEKKRAVGAFPTNASECIGWLLDLDEQTGLLEEVRTGGRAVHVGPGGFLGVECALAALGAGEIEAIDAFSFAMDYPDVTARREQYEQARTALAERTDATTTDRWDALFTEREGHTELISPAITLRYPHRFSSLPLPDGSANLVCSYAVLEHVLRPERAVAEAFRALAPGAMTAHRILSRDHRSYGTVAGYTPFSFREHSPEQWKEAVGDGFWQNRVAPFQWRALFEKAGFKILHYRVLETQEISAAQRGRLHPDFSDWPDDVAAELDCDIVAIKP